MEAYLSNFSDETLLSEILPRFPYETLRTICLTDTRLDALCQDESLWSLKVQLDFPGHVQLKPQGVSWRDWYKLLAGRWLPLYYHGDIIGVIPFHPGLFNVTISLIVPYLIQLGIINDAHIVFINDQRLPVVIVKSPEMATETINIDYDSIRKILLLVDPQFNRKLDKAEKIRDPIRTKSVKNKLIILAEMTSRLGNPPIYGWLPIGQGNVANFYIVDPILDERMACNRIPKAELVQIAQRLGVPTDNPDQLCTLIQERLKEIGHII